MKLLRMLPRYIRDAFKSVFRNFSLSIASISCITVTLILVSVSIILSYNVEKFTKIVKDDVTVVTFLKTETTSEELEQIKSDVEKYDNVASVELYTKAQKKDELAKSNKTYENITSTWSDDKNPLHDELLVKVVDLEKIKTTVDKIKQIDKVYDVRYGEGMVEKLVVVFKGIQKTMIAIVIGLIIVTAFLIGNTIKLTIYSRKREIEIMRLVGASNTTVKFPFVVEGFVLGILGSIIPIGITIYGYGAFYKYFDGQLFSPLIKLVKPTPYVYTLSLILLALGAIVGMLGSARAVRKYLKI